MATIHKKFLFEGTIAGNATLTFNWNNPLHTTVLAYFAYAKVPAQLPGVTLVGEVGVVAVRHQSTRTGSDEPAVDRVEIDIKNFRSTPTGFVLYQSSISGAAE